MALSKLELKKLVSLKTKKGRRAEGRFLAEGIRLLEEALRANYRPEIILYAPSELNERGHDLIGLFSKKKIVSQSIAVKEINKISDTTSSQGIIGVFRNRNRNLEQLFKQSSRTIVVCDGIGDPGNMGTIMRSALAFGADGIISTGGSAEVLNPKTIRASMGSFFHLLIAESDAPEEVLRELKRHGFTIAIADTRGRNIVFREAGNAKVALVIGSEPHGAGSVFTEGADEKWKIPMESKVESLNAAMAGSVLLYWLYAGRKKK